MSKRVATAAAMAVTLAATAFAGSAIAASNGWRVVKSGSSSGEFAVTSISADLSRPRAVGVRLIGRVSSGTAVVSCSKGFGVASWSRSYRRAGLYKLPMTRGADSCMVVASVGGSGKVTVQILRG
jgi:hypothetical protein